MILYGSALPAKSFGFLILFFPVGSAHFLLETSTFVCISWNKSLTFLTPLQLECWKKRGMLIVLSPIVITNCQPHSNTLSNTFKSLSKCCSKNTNLFLQLLVTHCPVPHFINEPNDLRHHWAILSNGLASYFNKSPSNFSYRNLDMDQIRLSCLTGPLFHYRWSDRWAVANMIMVDPTDFNLGIQCL